MEANARELERIFDQTITYLVPLFQRPYVWNIEEHWAPLWEDIQTLLDQQLVGRKPHGHFLGAVVLERLPNSTGGNQARQVIDGQQRFTTLQLFFIAARDHATAYKAEKYAERFSDLVSNRANRIDKPDEVFKVWPTNSDRAAYRLVHGIGSVAALDKALAAQGDHATLSANIIEAYRYFHGKLAEWLSGSLDDDQVKPKVIEKTPLDRLEALWQIVRSALQLVVIDLDKDDETQVIFETLNARGAELLPADLIKNYLFRLCAAPKEEVEVLYENNWRPFETKFWREEVKQGRLKRPRIDFFINHYLAMATRDDVRSSHLFNTFKRYVRDTAEITACNPAALTAADHIRALARYGRIFATFYESRGHLRLANFLNRMNEIDTATFYPFLLYAYSSLMPARKEEFDEILSLVESYLVRRQIVNLTSKAYNRLFVDLISAADGPHGLTTALVRSQLLSGKGESSRFPDDAEVRKVLLREKLYNRLAQYKVRFILEALDAHAFNQKSEIEPRAEVLTIEHVLPQNWKEHWPLPSSADDALQRAAAEDARDVALHTLGNLTLITDRLNPALSNGPWTEKRPELLKFSRLNLTRYFHDSHADDWNETAIAVRGETLANQTLMIWPYPAAVRQ